MPWDGDWQDSYQSLELSEPEQGSEIQVHRLIETPVFSRAPIRRGIDYHDDYGQFANGGAPTIPYPVRSSLAQVVLIYESFISHYFSWIRRGSPEQLIQYGIDHPTAQASRFLKRSPVKYTQMSPRPKPQLRRYGFGRVGKSGIMGAPPRFNKALRVIDYSYNPPVYGGNE